MDQICLGKKDPSQITVMQKFKFDDEHEILHTRKTRQSGSNVSLETSTAYDGALSITKATKDDLMELCWDGAISKEYHSFYNSLPCVESCDHLPESDYEEKKLMKSQLDP